MTYYQKISPEDEAEAVSQQKREPAFDVVIPGHVNMIPDRLLSQRGKIMYGRLRSLAKSTGYCWAGNVFLAEIIGCHPRTIPKFLASMVDLGLIVIEYYSNRVTAYRKIWMAEIKDYSKYAVKGTPPCRKGHGSPYIQRQEDINISPIVPKPPIEQGPPQSPSAPSSPSPSARPAASSSRSKIREVKEARAPEVLTTPKQHDILLAKCGGDAAKLAAVYEKLSDWKISKSISGGNDYLSIIKWVFKACDADDLTSKSKDSARAENEEIRRWAEKCVGENHAFIKVGYNYVDIVRGSNFSKYQVHEPTFKNNVLHELAKFGYRRNPK